MSKGIFKPFKPPFKYGGYTYIFDAEDRVVCNVRGWGFLTGSGCSALKLSSKKATSIQDRIGEKLVELMNKEAVDGN